MLNDFVFVALLSSSPRRFKKRYRRSIIVIISIIITVFKWSVYPRMLSGSEVVYMQCYKFIMTSKYYIHRRQLHTLRYGQTLETCYTCNNTLGNRLCFFYYHFAHAVNNVSCVCFQLGSTVSSPWRSCSPSVPTSCS